MIPEATSRYEQRTTSISKHLTEALRRAFRNEWTGYATLMKHRIVNTIGDVNATEMYGPLLEEKRNGSTKIQSATNNNQGVYVRSRPYFQSLQGATQSSSSNESSSSQSNPNQTPTSTIQNSHQPKSEVGWAAIRHLAIYRRNGVRNITNSRKKEDGPINSIQILTPMLLRKP